LRPYNEREIVECDFCSVAPRPESLDMLALGLIAPVRPKLVLNFLGVEVRQASGEIA